MARLDQLIRVLHEQRAESLQLAVGKPAVLLRDGTTRPVTKEALTDAQIAALLREIAPRMLPEGSGRPRRYGSGTRPLRGACKSRRGRGT